MFWIGLVIGIILGAPLGTFVFSLLLTGKRSQIELHQIPLGRGRSHFIDK